MSAPVPMPYFADWYQAGCLKQQLQEAGTPASAFAQTALDALAEPPADGVAATAADKARSITPPEPDPALHGWG